MPCSLSLAELLRLSAFSFDDMGIGDALRGLRWLPWLESLVGSISVYLRPSLVGLANQLRHSSKVRFPHLNSILFRSRHMNFAWRRLAM